MREAQQGRPRVETPGLQHSKRSDGSVVREVLRFPDGSVLRHGFERETYASGARRALRHFERGEPVGEWTEWYEDGGLRFHYVHGPELSPQTFYGPDGGVRATGGAVEGARQGLWRFYRSDGSLAKEGEYGDGVKAGEWREFDADGAVIATRSKS